MKLTFRGWKREVTVHKRDVTPVEMWSGLRYRSDVKGGPLQWNTSTRAYGRVDDLGLTGSFLVEFSFDHLELKNWIEKFVEESPEEAARLLAEMQVKAVESIIARPQPPGDKEEDKESED